jgi:hypothetical protein
VFEVVVAGAGGDEVVGVGVPALGPGLDVVEFAADGAAVAVGEGADLVAGADVVGELGWRFVAVAAVVDEFAEGVGDEPPPGAGRVGGDLSGLEAGIGP